MSLEQIKSIRASLDIHDDGEISTERLLSMVADDCNCDVSDVVAVMHFAD